MDQADLLLLQTRQVTGRVHDEHQRHVVGVADADETGGLVRGVRVETTRQLHRLVGDHTDRPAVHTGETGDDVRSEVRQHLEEVLVIEDAGEHVGHVVTGVRVIRDDIEQLGVGLVRFIADRPELRRRFEGRGRQVVEQVTDVGEGVRLIGGDIAEVAALGLHPGTAEVLHVDLLAGDGLDDRGTGDEHGGLFLDADKEVGRRRGVHRAAGTVAQQDGDLRRLAGQRQLTPRDLGVHRQTHHGVLDTGSAGVVDADDRAADTGREVHDLADLVAEGLAHRAAEDGLVVGVDRHGTPVDPAVAGDDAVAVGRFVIAGGPGQGTDLGEGTGVQQLVDTLTRGGVTCGVALGPGAFTARVEGLLGAAPQVRQLLRGGASGSGRVAVGRRTCRVVCRVLSHTHRLPR